jgi:hypothetical protein
MLDSDPALSTPETREEVEFIQFTDVLTGVLWDAVLARQADERTKAGRRHLVREMRDTDHPTILLPWAGRLPIARSVSVSIYPDEYGSAYPATVLMPRPGQQSMEFDGLFAPRSQRVAPNRLDEMQDIQAAVDGGERYESSAGAASVDYLPEWEVGTIL